MVRAMREGLARGHRLQERDRVRQAGGDDLAVAPLVGLRSPAPTTRARKAVPLRLQQAERVEIDIDALQVAQHPDVEKVGRVRRALHRLELVRPEPVEHDMRAAARHADLRR